MAQTDCIRTTWAIMLIAAALLGAGCDEQTVAPPVTLDEYNLQARRRGAFPDVVIAQHNLHRVTDAALPMDERRLSLEVVAHLKDSAPEAMASLASLFNAPSTSPELRSELIGALLRSNDPAMTPFVVSALQQPNLRGANEDAMLAWLSRNAS